MEKYKVFTWNQDRFPTLEKLLSELKSMGVKPICIIDPGVKVDEDYYVYKEGMKEGPGILEDAEGIRYEGTFHRDLKNGEFVEKDRNGKVLRRVHYVNGVVQNLQASNL